MTTKIRRLLTVLLLAALPLQGQAVASMSCHYQLQSSQMVAQDHSQHHQHETVHASHIAHVALDTQQVVSQDSTSTDLRGISSCALCAASCAMAHVIPARTSDFSEQHQSCSIYSSQAYSYSSIVLEGLLRPPRS